MGVQGALNLVLRVQVRQAGPAAAVQAAYPLGRNQVVGVGVVVGVSLLAVPVVMRAAVAVAVPVAAAVSVVPVL